MSQSQAPQISNDEALRNARILEKLQDDTMGRLLVRNAFQACVIEDQNEALQQLRRELVAKSESGAGSDDDPPTGEDTV